MMDLDRTNLDVNLPLQDIDVDLLAVLFIRTILRGLAGLPLSPRVGINHKSYWLTYRGNTQRSCSQCNYYHILVSGLGSRNY